MTTAADLLGQWRGRLMGDPRTRSYDVLVFREDGSGFQDLYEGANRFTEQFRWSVEAPGLLRLDACQRFAFDQTCSAFRETTPTPNLVADFRIQEELLPTVGRMRVLRFASNPWPALSEYRLFYREDVVILATFRAPCFVRSDERPDGVFHGKALSDYLAQQLEARKVLVGPREEVFFGACYYRVLEINGRHVGLRVNRAEESDGWRLLLDRPADGGTVEVEAVYGLLHEILQGVEGLDRLEWQTEAAWRGRNSRPSQSSQEQDE
jgi:hypothetical protein